MKKFSQHNSTPARDLHLTTVEAAMLRLLADGETHAAADLHACLADDLGPHSNVYAHVTALRKKLRVKNLGIIRSARGYQLALVVVQPIRLPVEEVKILTKSFSKAL